MRKGRGKALSIEQRNDLFDLYKTGNYTTKDLSFIFPMKAICIRRLLNRHGYKTPSLSEAHRKYSLNQKFFDIIDTEEKAYILGLLYADGCVHSSKNSVMISLKESDYKLLEDIKKILTSNKPLYYNKGINRHEGSYVLEINSKRIKESLQKIGCVSRKSLILLFPEEKYLSQNLYRHFIRGYFDGDGCITRNRIEICGTEMFCGEIVKIVKSELNINFVMTALPNSINTFRKISFGGGNQMRKFLDWLYVDSTIYLERKHERYIELLEFKKMLTKRRTCSIDNCGRKHYAKGYCISHYYFYGGLKEKRKEKQQLQKLLKQKIIK